MVRSVVLPRQSSSVKLRYCRRPQEEALRICANNDVSLCEGLVVCVLAPQLRRHPERPFDVPHIALWRVAEFPRRVPIQHSSNPWFAGGTAASIGSSRDIRRWPYVSIQTCHIRSGMLARLDGYYRCFTISIFRSDCALMTTFVLVLFTRFLFHRCSNLSDIPCTQIHCRNVSGKVGA